MNYEHPYNYLRGGGGAKKKPPMDNVFLSNKMAPFEIKVKFDQQKFSSKSLGKLKTPLKPSWDTKNTPRNTPLNDWNSGPRALFEGLTAMGENWTKNGTLENLKLSPF